jgi:pyruvate/2-oxoglutarate dehydrogenase complex dihydrolipoamide dehydrogenase (E3) component
MAQHVVVLGGGATGEAFVGTLRRLDKNVRITLVEDELVGGECSYWACIPSKTLLRPGEALAAAREAPGAREAVTGEIDVQQAFAWRDFQVSDYDDSGQVAWLEGEGIELIRGDGRIEGPGKVAVGDKTYTTTHIVISTGSEPAIPPVPGLRGLDGIWTNREATGIKEVPKRVIVLGAGPVGVEMGQALTRLGSSVAIVEGADRVLSHEPAALGDALGQVLAAEGIELKLGRLASGVSREGDEYVVELEDAPALRADNLLVATGRRPRVENIGLETIAIEPGRQGIEVDERRLEHPRPPPAGQLRRRSARGLH